MKKLKLLFLTLLIFVFSSCYHKRADVIYHPPDRQAIIFKDVNIFYMDAYQVRFTTRRGMSFTLRRKYCNVIFYKH